MGGGGITERAKFQMPMTAKGALQRASQRDLKNFQTTGNLFSEREALKSAATAQTD